MLKTTGILRAALYSWSPDIQLPKSPETTPVCCFTVAMLPCSDASASVIFVNENENENEKDQQFVHENEN